MKRRHFLGALGAVSVLDWMGFFRDNGVPGTPKDWGIAKARAQEEEEPRFLIYWFLEGGWASYSMFTPVDTPNHSGFSEQNPILFPNPGWSSQFYRTTGYEDGGVCTTERNGFRFGFLAAPGEDLFDDMAVVSSHTGNVFHSGGRFDYHYGRYSRSLASARGDDERTVMQAFCEARGSGMLMPHVSWHRWLADGELDPSAYPPGTGYYEQLGPTYAHTVYGRTSANLKARLRAVGDLNGLARRQRVAAFADDLRANLLAGKDGQSVRSFHNAVESYRALATGELPVDLETLFEDPVLKDEFGVQPEDESPTFFSVDGRPARSKETPHIRVQAMMAYELMRAGISCGLWLESRDVRGFDTHISRLELLQRDSYPNQLGRMTENLWDPLRAFAARLKATPCPGLPDKTLWDQTTIVVGSEMGRTISGNVNGILTSTNSTNQKLADIFAQDVGQHWDVSACAFLGGQVQGGRQYGRVGTETLSGIPINLSDGSLHPGFDPITGLGNLGQGTVTDAGHVYATALYLAGIDPEGKGRNVRPPMTFIKKP